MKTIYIEKTDAMTTLTTWIYCAFWQMWSAEQMGLKSYINWFDGANPARCLLPYHDKEMFAKVPNQFEWYFKQPMISEPPPRNKSEVWEWENCKQAGDYPFMSQPLNVIKDYYKKHIHFQPEVDRRAKLIVDKYSIDFTKTIGITWRGTDGVTDGRARMAIETYFPFIDEVLEKEPDLRIMCTAEETNILDPLLTRYKNAFVIDEFRSAPNGSLVNPERLAGVSGYEKGLQPALMMWLFSKCAHYIKNRSSCAAVSAWLSSGRIVSLAHQENLSYNLFNDKAEINGVLQPLLR